MRKLLEEEIEDIEQEIYTEIEDFLDTNLVFWFESDFLEKMRDEIYNWIEQQSQLENWNMTDLPIDIEYAIQETCRYYDIPLRQNQNQNQNPKPEKNHDKSKTEFILSNLNQQPAIKQRTKEWYEIRQTCFSASNLWKVFSTQAQQNSLIYEKCNPESSQKKRGGVSNATNPLNWGIKYEPVSIQIYEHRNPGTKVKTDYSCILHPAYPFIGASPDGIVISGEKTGRMVEVKNIYNREITGIPLDEYWVQMQIQMETCDLDECDFLETRIQEYETATAFYADSLAEYKGVILFFLPKLELEIEKSPFFEYMPLYISLDEQSIQKWIEDMQEKHREYILYETVYWKLDEYSCILVERNNDWFSSVLPKIEATWKMVEAERITGYEHRAPNRRNNTHLEGEGSNRRNNTHTEGEGSNRRASSIDSTKSDKPEDPNPNQIKVIKLSHALLPETNPPPPTLDFGSLAW
jgi:putative phage-type endonuclease